jgi:hypothetical protein
MKLFKIAIYEKDVPLEKLSEICIKVALQIERNHDSNGTVYNDKEILADYGFTEL